VGLLLTGSEDRRLKSPREGELNRIIKLIGILSRYRTCSFTILILKISMNFSIKNTLPVWILLFSCFFLRSAEAVEETSYFTECTFWEKEDCIKVKMPFREGTIPESTVYKINNPDPKGVSVRIKNDQLEYLETFYQIVDIEVHAVPSDEEMVVWFEIIENLERISTDENILTYKLTNSSRYFLETDKHVNFRQDVLPLLTFSKNSPDTKYLRIFTKP